jgi:hypothetical protein
MEYRKRQELKSSLPSIEELEKKLTEQTEAQGN